LRDCGITTRDKYLCIFAAVSRVVLAWQPQPRKAAATLHAMADNVLGSQ